jgi:hypothetical protein
MNEMSHIQGFHSCKSRMQVKQGVMKKPLGLLLVIPLTKGLTLCICNYMDCFIVGSGETHIILHNRVLTHFR